MRGMRRIRPSSLAYLAFVLACLIPSLRYRHLFTAQTQLHLAGPLFYHPGSHDQGPSGLEYLERVMREDPSPATRDKAADLLLEYSAPGVIARVAVLYGSGFTRPGIDQLEHNFDVDREDWGRAVDGAGDDELVVMLRRAVSAGDGRSTTWDFWEARPSTCERVLARMLGSTADLKLAASVTQSSYVDVG